MDESTPGSRCVADEGDTSGGGLLTLCGAVCLPISVVYYQPGRHRVALPEPSAHLCAHPFLFLTRWLLRVLFGVPCGLYVLISIYLLLTLSFSLYLYISHCHLYACVGVFACALPVCLSVAFFLFIYIRASLGGRPEYK